MKKIFLKTCIPVIILLGCEKATEDTNPASPDDPPEYPVRDFAFNKTNGIKDGFKLTQLTKVGNIEYGIEFQTSKKGTLIGLGVNLPVHGDYVTSLWDADTKNLIVQDTFHHNSNGHDYFSYEVIYAVGTKNKVPIVPGKKYMAGLLLPPISDQGIPASDYPAYKISKNDNSNVWPFSQKSITVTGNYSKKTSIPAYPDVINPRQNVLFGLVDFDLETE